MHADIFCFCCRFLQWIIQFELTCCIPLNSVSAVYFFSPPENAATHSCCIWRGKSIKRLTRRAKSNPDFLLSPEWWRSALCCTHLAAFFLSIHLQGKMGDPEICFPLLFFDGEARCHSHLFFFLSLRTVISFLCGRRGEIFSYFVECVFALIWIIWLYPPFFLFF